MTQVGSHFPTTVIRLDAIPMVSSAIKTTKLDNFFISTFLYTTTTRSILNTTLRRNKSKIYIWSVFSKILLQKDRYEQEAHDTTGNPAPKTAFKSFLFQQYFHHVRDTWMSGCSFNMNGCLRISLKFVSRFLNSRQ